MFLFPNFRQTIYSFLLLVFVVVGSLVDTKGDCDTQIVNHQNMTHTSSSDESLSSPIAPELSLPPRLSSAAWLICSSPFLTLLWSVSSTKSSSSSSSLEPIGLSSSLEPTGSLSSLDWIASCQAKYHIYLRTYTAAT